MTVGCAERGLLLLRLRDEMRMTLAAYQVSSSSIYSPLLCTFGVMFTSTLAVLVYVMLRSEDCKDEPLNVMCVHFMQQK